VRQLGIGLEVIAAVSAVATRVALDGEMRRLVIVRVERNAEDDPDLRVRQAVLEGLGAKEE